MEKLIDAQALKSCFRKEFGSQFSEYVMRSIISTIDKQPEVEKAMDEKVKGEASREEGYAQVIRGLISYHERMTMGNYPERDFYLDALRFALACVEEKTKR